MTRRLFLVLMVTLLLGSTILLLGNIPSKVTAAPVSSLSLTPEPRLYLPILRTTTCNQVEDFSNPASGWEFNTSNPAFGAAYESGEYQLYINQPAGVVPSSAPGCKGFNYTVEVDARWNGSNTTKAAYGVIFGVNEEADLMYGLGINTTFRFIVIYRIDFTGGPILNELYISEPELDAINWNNLTNKIKVIRNGANIVVEINGEQVYGGQDSTYLGLSGAGVWAGLINDPNNPFIDARFDNFLMTILP